MERVADYVVNRLYMAGARHVFLVTGRGILFLTDAVAKKTELKAVPTFHEQGASYAAMAYAKITGGVAVCLVSTGCAATNAITAALCAWQDNIPVVFVSGQHMLEETTRYTGLPIRTYGSQEADIVSIVKPITKYAVMISETAQVGVELDKAIRLATTGRKGPVWVDLPLNVQNALIEPANLEHEPILCTSAEGEFLDVGSFEACVQDVVKGIGSAERPLMVLGGGVRTSNANQFVEKFVQKTGIPVVFTPTAADVYGAGNERSIGSIGSIGGSRAGNFALQQADYVLIIGSRLCSQITGAEKEQFASSARIIVVDIDIYEHQKDGVNIDTFIHSDAKKFLQRLNEAKLPSVNQEWQAKCLHWKRIFSIGNEAFVQQIKQQGKIDLYSFADTLDKKLSTDAVVITDAGFEELIIPSAISYRANQRCLFPAAQGAMGYAVPAILGAYFAGKNDIVAVVGDGSIMMNIQELYIIAEHKIPAKLFVINNNMYAVIRNRQRFLFRKRTIGNDPSDGVPAPDFSAIAASVGIRYVRLNNYTELQDRLEDILALPEMVMCEVMCVADQEYIHKSYRRNEKRHYEKCPLDDLSPFMERDLLNRERIVGIR